MNSLIWHACARSFARMFSTLRVHLLPWRASGWLKQPFSCAGFSFSFAALRGGCLWDCRAPPLTLLSCVDCFFLLDWGVIGLFWLLPSSRIAPVFCACKHESQHCRRPETLQMPSDAAMAMSGMTAVGGRKRSSAAAV